MPGGSGAGLLLSELKYWSHPAQHPASIAGTFLHSSAQLFSAGNPFWPKSSKGNENKDVRVTERVITPCLLQGGRQKAVSRQIYTCVMLYLNKVCAIQEWGWMPNAELAGFPACGEE